MTNSTRNHPRIVLWEETQLGWISKTFCSFFTKEYTVTGNLYPAPAVAARESCAEWPFYGIRVN